MAINSKQKGNRNEREACRFMERWTGQKFIRVANSGGIHEITPWLAGDICPADPEYFRHFNTVIETKHLKYLGCLDGSRRNSKIQRIWEQAETDRIRVNAKNSLLLLRQNQMKAGTFIVVGHVRTEYLKELSWFLQLGDLLLFESDIVLDYPVECFL